MCRVMMVMKMSSGEIHRFKYSAYLIKKGQVFYERGLKLRENDDPARCLCKALGLVDQSSLFDSRYQRLLDVFSASDSLSIFNERAD